MNGELRSQQKTIQDLKDVAKKVEDKIGGQVRAPAHDGYGLRQKNPRPSLIGLVKEFVVIMNLRVVRKIAQVVFVFLDVVYPSLNTIWRDLDDRSE